MIPAESTLLNFFFIGGCCVVPLYLLLLGLVLGVGLNFPVSRKQLTVIFLH
jgi:hypothetical protein